jgi:hypothetical protein
MGKSTTKEGMFFTDPNGFVRKFCSPKSSASSCTSFWTDTDNSWNPWCPPRPNAEMKCLSHAPRMSFKWGLPYIHVHMIFHFMYMCMYTIVYVYIYIHIACTYCPIIDKCMYIHPDTVHYVNLFDYKHDYKHIVHIAICPTYIYIYIYTSIFR